MQKKIPLSLFLFTLSTISAFGQMDQNVYPYKPLASDLILSKARYLSEDANPLVNIHEIVRLGLSKGKPTYQPWSGPYWNLKQGMIANPYQERTIFQYVHFIPTIDDIEPYMKRRNYIMTNEAQLTEKELARLAPSEKYDLLLGNELDLSNRIWDFINTWNKDMKWDYLTSIEFPGDEYEIEKKNYIVANWEGICHGWAPASGVVPKPEKTVVATLPDGRKLPFYPEDIKGLISLTWANSLVQDQVLSEGLRCKRISPKRDKYGRYYDTIPENGEILPRCADVHPAVMHVTLANVTGKQGRSFIIDKDAKVAVSNQPVAGYEFQYFHPGSGEDLPFHQALIPYEDYRKSDPYRDSRNPDIKFIVGVESVITYADWTMIKDPKSSDYLDDETSELKSIYDLEIDFKGNIIGGQWRGLKDLNLIKMRNRNGSVADRAPQMRMTRPDFLWIVPKNYKNYFKNLSGLEAWDLQSGTPIPESWRDASRVAHAFYYKASKHFGTQETCKVKSQTNGEVLEVPCEFNYPRPQPLIQIVNQLIELSSNR